ncbi:CD151 antigen-like [Rhopilema esculentum]|uniref:CD151 antigen-like n=1 Tax=Rhopilema esculentum TaxID=499914 RepID=UPI0031D2A65C
MANEGLGCGMTCLKYLLFAFNFLFWIAGIGVLGVGIWSRVQAKDYDSFLGDGGLTSAANVMIAAGAFVMVIGFVGCCGAWKESKWLLVIYFILLLFIFILEIAAGIFAYVKKDKVIKTVSDNVKKSIKTNYGASDQASKTFTKSIDFMQKELKCCGVNGPSDWNNTVWYQKYRGSLETPKSCCKDQKAASCGTSSSDNFSKGCVKAMEDYVSSHIAIIGGIGVGIAFVQLLGMVCAMCLCRATSYDNIK